MANLFGLPTPSEVRQQTRGKLFESINAQPFSGLNAGMNRAGANIGAAIGSALAGASPKEQRAAKIQGINKTFTDNWISKNGKPETPEEINRYGTGLMSEFMQAGELGMAMNIRKQLPDVEGGVDNYNEISKESRKAAREVVKSVDTASASMRADYEKLRGLSIKAKGTGTTARAARNSMIANIVRLNSPGIVQETELRTYTGGQGSTSAMLGWLTGAGYDTDAIKSYIDPSGDNFDADGMLELGGTLVLGRAQPVFDRLDDAKARAKAAKISPRAYDSIFSGTKNIDAMYELKASIPPPGWVKMTDPSGKKAWVNPNNPQEFREIK